VQAAAIKPLPGATAKPATASVKTRRLSKLGGPATPQLFLDFYDRFGALQPKLQAEVVSPRKRKFRQRVWFGGFGAALAGAQRFEGACGALTPPVPVPSTRQELYDAKTPDSVRFTTNSWSIVMIRLPSSIDRPASPDVSRSNVHSIVAPCQKFGGFHARGLPKSSYRPHPFN
jgi:hypothetical protein